MLICAGCLCAGQFLWKRYDTMLSLLVGFVIYGLGALSMICAYRFGELSVLQPINSITYVISVALGAIYFQEAVTILKVVGVAVIMAGVIVLAGSSGKT